MAVVIMNPIEPSNCVFLSLNLDFGTKNINRAKAKNVIFTRPVNTDNTVKIPTCFKVRVLSSCLYIYKKYAIVKKDNAFIIGSILKDAAKNILNGRHAATNNAFLYIGAFLIAYAHNNP